MNSIKIVSYLSEKGVDVDSSPHNHYWKTRVCKINNISQFLDYPLEHVMYAVHSIEYLANYCLDGHEQGENEKQKHLNENPNAKLIEYNFKLDNNGSLIAIEKER